MTSDFVTELGLGFLAHRLRRMSERLVESYGRWLPDAGVTAPPRSISTLLLLREEGVLSVTDIADRIQFTHPVVISLVADLEERGFTQVMRDPKDRRRRMIALTREGRQEADRAEQATLVMERGFKSLGSEMDVELLDMITKMEAACARLPFDERLREVSRSRARRNGAAPGSAERLRRKRA